MRTNTTELRAKRSKRTELSGSHDAKPPLKSVHARINCLILRHVIFPAYLHGGIRDEEHPRDYVSSARVHQSARFLICEDIQNFFPSITTALITDIWIGLLHCDPTVATALTKLTTKGGSLPQGAKTSTSLANLVFWREEPSLVAYLRGHGIAYTRFVDDINCSAQHVVERTDLTDIVRRLHGMVRKYGLRLKRAKHRVYVQGSRMVTTNLVVNRRVSLASEERSAIRRMVKKLETSAATDRDTASYVKRYLSVSGKIGKLKRFHAREAGELRKRLKAIAPR